MNRTNRPINVEGIIAKVPVYTKGKIIHALIDADDVLKVDRMFWCLTKAGYVVSRHGYLHRIIMQPGYQYQVDHINNDKLDNRKENLRVVTNQQNQMARHVPVSSSGYKGVQRRGDRWRAYIKLNQKIITLGTYPSPRLAAAAYNEAALNLFGEYAVINDIGRNYEQD